MVDARRHYEEALKIRRDLAKQNAEAYLPYLAMTLNDLGVLDGSEDRTEDARLHYEEALQLYRQLAQQEPDMYSRYLAGTLNNLAFLYGNENRVDEARADYTEALRIYRKLYEIDSERYAGDVARVQGSMEHLARKFPPTPSVARASNIPHN
jgi:tetratricopeptide (TPR) repeat protein